MKANTTTNAAGAMQPAATRATLVYQAGIANVFAVECSNLAPFGREARRLMQADFAACENFARGLVAAGARWTEDLEAQPFSDKFRPVDSNDAREGK